MLDILLLRFDAPLQSFGGPAVDAHGVVRDFPCRSLLTGLLGNALGVQHGEFERLDRLQQRIRYAVRLDHPGTRLVDFQSVDLGQPALCGTGWTTWGRTEGRDGASSEQTHLRYRHYLADAVCTVALCLDAPEEDPGVSALEQALREPERPLFLGRKTCLPAGPLLLGRASFASLVQALIETPLAPPRPGQPGDGPWRRAWWPAEEEAPSGSLDDPRPDAVEGTAPEGEPQESSRLIPLTEDRDWANQIHCGRRFVREGRLRVRLQEAADDGRR